MVRSSSLPWPLLSYLSLLTPVYAADPISAKWSESTFGPDGPWPAVEVKVGRSQTIALYPGHEFQTYLLSNEVCNNNKSQPCYASQAGTYNRAQATVDKSGSTGQIVFKPGSNYMSGLDVKGAAADQWLDNLDLQAGSNSVIPNVSMALINSSFSSYPDGSWFPLSVGCLGVGAPDTINQTFTTSTVPINASLIPGYLDWKNRIDSNSFSMHIGSANPPMPGSLIFGGYDRNRIVGQILTLTDSGDISNPVTLKDISINVIDGSSPFKFGASQTGLLAEGNSSLSGAGLKTRIDGCSPYLSLPASTCKAIASHLPVTLNSNLGLYTWNTNDPQYSKIVNSASALQFTFTGAKNTDSITVAVPFRHLNLTLDAPLVTTKTQYFPCYIGSSSQYTLGRAFLQDAFIGANWAKKTWWLAQAPGPNVPSPSVINMATGATTLTASGNDWKTSWSGSWKALTPAEASSSATVAPITDPNNPPTGGTTDTGLSTGAKAGIGVGVGAVALGALGVLFFFLRRRRNSKNDVGPAGPTNNGATPQHGYYDPVKNPASPNMTDQSIYSPNTHLQHASVYNPSYNPSYNSQQGYSGAGTYGSSNSQYPQQQFAAELPGGGMGAPAQEMPAQPYVPHSELPGDGVQHGHGTLR